MKYVYVLLSIIKKRKAAKKNTLPLIKVSLIYRITCRSVKNVIVGVTGERFEQIYDLHTIINTSKYNMYPTSKLLTLPMYLQISSCANMKNLLSFF